MGFSKYSYKHLNWDISNYKYIYLITLNPKPTLKDPSYFSPRTFIFKYPKSHQTLEALGALTCRVYSMYTALGHRFSFPLGVVVCL